MQEENTAPVVPGEPVVAPEIIEQPMPASPAAKPPFFVFNFNTLLGLVLLAGVAVLYYLHFSNREPAAPAIPAASVQKATGKSISVVYVNLDSLNLKYEYVKTLRSELEGTGRKLQTEVLGEQAALEKEANEFQRQMAANIIPEDKAKLQYEQLMKRQQALIEKKDRYTQMVAEKELNMNIKLMDSVTAFLKRFNRQYKFDYIMGFKAGGEILLSNDTLDITSPVLDALNKEFHSTRK